MEIKKSAPIEKSVKPISGMLLLLMAAILLAGCSAHITSIPKVGATPSAEYRLNVNRLFGYSSGSQIKGSFRLNVIGISDIQSVEYQIDGKTMDVVNIGLFQLDFQTEKYPIGVHSLSAWVTTKSGKVIEIPSRSFEFATLEQESKSVVGVVLPLGGIVLLGVGLGLQFIASRKRPHEFTPLGTARKYGIRGGAICPKCGRPTVLHPFSFNVGFRKVYDFCVNCGKWSRLKILSEKDLRSAEEKERQTGQGSPTSPKSEDEKLKEMLDNSKYSQ